MKNIKTLLKVMIIEQSRFWDEKWYVGRYPDVKDSGLSPAEFYLTKGWKMDHDPSENFSTSTYLQLNEDLVGKDICPLYHFEKFGKNERRAYAVVNGKVVRGESARFRMRAKAAKAKNYMYFMACSATNRVNNKKIVFRTFQNDYTCNPKYICEELLRRNKGYDIVWLINPAREENFPKGVRLVKNGSHEAIKELTSAKVIIDNGSLPFRMQCLKKKEQVSINTWHGSLGFKRLDGNQIKKNTTTVELYGKINDLVISNSKFEDDVFRNSYWKNNEFIECGHPRNDILVSCSEDKKAEIRKKVCGCYGIPENMRLVLYAPTFREKLIDAEDVNTPEDIDLDALCDSLEKKFGGEWGVLVRAHHVNAKAENNDSAERHQYYIATDYPDIQELMVAADAGVTDYSSWILDYMFTRKPAFLFTPDYDDYDLQRGFYYPLSESPFPAGRDNRELSAAVESFDNEDYIRRIDEFLVSKGSREDGHGSETVADRIISIIENK